MVPPPSKRGARAAAAIQAALLLLVLTPLASWLLSGGKQAVQCRSACRQPACRLPSLAGCGSCL